MKNSKSSTCSAESAGSPSDLKEPEGLKQLPFAKSTRSVRKSCGSTGRACRSTKISKPCQPKKSGATLSVEGSPARTSALQEKGPDSPVSVRGYGGTWHEPLVWLDRESLLWKTWQRCLEGGWETYSQTWPRSGMMRNGIAYQLPTLGPGTGGTEYGWLPTLGTTEGRGSSRKRFRGSKHFRGAKTSEGLRICEADPIYLNPSFGELIMGFPVGYTLLETPLSPKSPKSSDAQSSKE